MDVEHPVPGGRERRVEREAPLDFGTKLRQARERRGLSLRQIAITTKISMTALEALERNDPSRLPGGIFSRAFVRSYAAEVGLDPERTVREFIEQFPSEAAGSPAAHAAEAPEEEFESRRQAAGAVLRLVVLSIPLVGLVLYFTMFRTPRSDAGRTVSVVQDAPVGPEPAPGLLPAGSGDAAPGPGPAPVAAATTSASPGGGLTIELRPTGPCWVAVTTDGGQRSVRLMQSGDTLVRRADQEIILQVGDAAACAFAINDAPARALGGSGQVVVTRITPDNYRTFLQP